MSRTILANLEPDSDFQAAGLGHSSR